MLNLSKGYREDFKYSELDKEKALERGFSQELIHEILSRRLGYLLLEKDNKCDVDVIRKIEELDKKSNMFFDITDNENNSYKSLIFRNGYRLHWMRDYGLQISGGTTSADGDYGSSGNYYLKRVLNYGVYSKKECVLGHVYKCLYSSNITDIKYSEEDKDMLTEFVDSITKNYEWSKPDKDEEPWTGNINVTNNSDTEDVMKLEIFRDDLALRLNGKIIGKISRALEFDKSVKDVTELYGYLNPLLWYMLTKYDTNLLDSFKVEVDDLSEFINKLTIGEDEYKDYKTELSTKYSIEPTNKLVELYSLYKECQSFEIELNRRYQMVVANSRDIIVVFNTSGSLLIKVYEKISKVKHYPIVFKKYHGSVNHLLAVMLFGSADYGDKSLLSKYIDNSYTVYNLADQIYEKNK